MRHIMLLIRMFFITSLSLAGPYHSTIEYVFPLPDSKALSPQTTIILRFHQQYIAQIDNLENLIQVTGSIHGSYTGTVFFSTDERTIIFKPDSKFQNDEEMTVTIQTSRFVAADFIFNFSIESSGSNVPTTAMPEPAIIEMDAPRDLAGSATDVRVINGVAVPNDFPTITTSVTGETAPGKIFYSTHFINSHGVYVIAVENDGTPYLFKRFDNAYFLADFLPLPDGNFSVFYSFHGWKHAILNPSMDIIDAYEGAHGYDVDEHEFILLENGHALMTLQKNMHVDMSQIVPGGQNSADVEINMFQEYDTDKNVIFEWRTWDHLRMEDAVSVNLTVGYIDYVHMNSVSLDYDGHYIVSLRHLNEITKINRNTGETIWRFGGVNNEFTLSNDELGFSYQHHVRAVEGSPGHYTVFDNGNTRTPNYSRAVEYKLDTLAMTAEKVWEYRYSPDRVCPWMGVVQRLPNGNTFVDGTASDPPILCVEVNPAGEKVFELKSFGHINYRAYRFDVEVNARKPYFVIDNYGNILNLIFNKFGDKNVAYYKIFHRIKEDSEFTLVDSTRNTWYQYTYYDSTGLAKFGNHDFRVTAVGNDGIESDSSNILRESVTYTNNIPGSNLITNGDFQSDQNWNLQTENSGNATGNISNEGYTVDILEGGESVSDVKLVQENVTLIKGLDYTLEFDAYAAEERYISAELLSNGSPATNYSKIGLIPLTGQKKHFSFTFTMEYANDSNALLAIECGMFDIDVTIDNVSLVIVDKSAVEKSELSSPKAFRLDQNYPNPFNPTTTIRYTLEKNGPVSLKLFSVTGQELMTLVNQHQKAGTHHVILNAKMLPSGVFFYRLSVGNQSQIKKLIILK